MTLINKTTFCLSAYSIMTGKMIVLEGHCYLIMLLHRAMATKLNNKPP